MPKEEWGTKRLCPTTGRRFYDLNKDPIISPYSGETVILDADTKSRAAIAENAGKESGEELELVDDGDEMLKDGGDSDSKIEDDLLEDDDDDSNVSLDSIADVPAEDDED